MRTAVGPQRIVKSPFIPVFILIVLQNRVIIGDDLILKNQALKRHGT